MRKIKVAQIGTSLYSHGSDIWDYINSMPDIFDVVGFALPENERVVCESRTQRFDSAREMTVEEILSNPEIEAVIVETEEIHLTKYALMAAKAGKHIHMEKPGSQNLEDFEELIKTVKQNNSILHIGYMYRYNPAVMDIMKQAKSGELGEIISVDTAMCCVHPVEFRQFLHKFKGGMMFFLGCHLVDMIYSIQGEPKNIIPLSRPTNLDGLTVEDFGMAVLEYENGVSIIRTNDIEYGGFPNRHLSVVGSKKTAEVWPLEILNPDDTMSSLKTDYSKTDWLYTGDITNYASFTRYGKMMNSFAEMVRGEKQNPCTPEYELGLYKLILKCCGM